MTEDINSALFAAVTKGDEDKVTQILQGQEKVNVNCRMTYKDTAAVTPLLAAAAEGHTSMVQLLINNRADLKAKDETGNSALMLSVKSADTVAALLQAGASVHAINNRGSTALHHACDWGYDETVKVLLEHGSLVRAITNNCQTPLHRAVTAARSSTIQLLLESDSPVNTPDNSGWVPLHVAAHNGMADVIELLIRNDASINAKTDNGQNPLHRAVDKDIEIVKLLLAYNQYSDFTTKPIDQSDQLGETPLHLACWKCQPEAVMLLLRAGAQRDARNASGHTPEMKLLKEQQSDWYSLEKAEEILKIIRTVNITNQ